MLRTCTLDSSRLSKDGATVSRYVGILEEEKAPVKDLESFSDLSDSL